MNATFGMKIAPVVAERISTAQFLHAKFGEIFEKKLLTIYVLRLVNSLTCDLHNFVKIHFQIEPPSANHLHFQGSFHPELHFGGIWGF
jgi:hypothetical protein